MLFVLAPRTQLSNYSFAEVWEVWNDEVLDCDDLWCVLANFLLAKQRYLVLFVCNLHLWYYTMVSANTVASSFPTEGERTFWATQCDALPPVDAQWLATVCAQLVLIHASQFARRITEVLAEWPYKLLQLICKPPEEQCSVRQSLCQEILGQNNVKQHVVARKLKEIYSEDLKHGCKTGSFSPGSPLVLALNKLKEIWKSNTACCERVNKMLSMFGERYPAAANELISSRASIKFALCDVVAATDSRGRLIPRKLGTCHVNFFSRPTCNGNAYFFSTICDYMCIPYAILQSGYRVSLRNCNWSCDCDKWLVTSVSANMIWSGLLWVLGFQYYWVGLVGVGVVKSKQWCMVHEPMNRFGLLSGVLSVLMILELPARQSSFLLAAIQEVVIGPAICKINPRWVFGCMGCTHGGAFWTKTVDPLRHPQAFAKWLRTG